MLGNTLIANLGIFKESLRNGTEQIVVNKVTIFLNVELFKIIIIF